jgi:hypothetical protein
VFYFIRVFIKFTNAPIMKVPKVKALLLSDDTLLPITRNVASLEFMVEFLVDTPVFFSIGPFWHKAFKDALPEMLAIAIPDIDNFVSSDPDDDHFGTSYMEYNEDVPTDGFIHNNHIPSAIETSRPG